MKSIFKIWRCLCVGLAGAAVLLLSAAPCAAQASPSLDGVLARATKHVESFVDQFSAVKCTEKVTQAKLGKNARVELKTETVFDYLAFLQSADGDLTVNESRLEQARKADKQNASLLVTNGFSTLLMIFHPTYRGSFQFERLPDVTVDGKLRWVVGFRHMPGYSSPTVLLLRGREYPLDLTGEALIDPVSGAITRITSTLQNPMDDVGLRIFRSDVQYSPIPFSGMNGAYWLPTVATIDLQTTKQHWRNIHRFIDYQRFNVDTQSTIGSTP